MPKVSIIMGTYNCNGNNELIESVNSVINQSYTDWELIICDDGSTDNTIEFLHKISNLDSRIVILSYKENKGLANALNTCIMASKGNFIARQDADDISDIDRIQKQVEFLENNIEYSIVGTIASVHDANGVWGEYIVPEEPLKKDFFWNSPFIHPVVMMKKEDLLKVNCYRVAKETRRCEDLDLFLRMYSNGMRGYNIQQKLFSYKITNSNKKYRPMKYRIDEAKVRLIGYKNLGILIQGLPFVIKPIIIGLIPQFIFRIIRKKQY
jgi:glycosyltransferase involved in cell wall biosynthesis